MSEFSGTRSVASLYVLCSLPMRSDALAMSDRCRKSATCAVKIDSNFMYRCREHDGIRSLFGSDGTVVLAESVTEVPWRYKA